MAGTTVVASPGPADETERERERVRESERASALNFEFRTCIESSIDYRCYVILATSRRKQSWLRGHVSSHVGWC